MKTAAQEPLTRKPKPAARVTAKTHTGDFEQGLISFLPNLKAFACSLTRDVAQAEDLVQDTVLRALDNQEKFIRGSNLLAWLFTILRNLFLSEIRRNRTYAEIIPQIVARADPNVAGNQHNHLQLAELMSAVAELPPHQRRAVTLVGALGYSYEETADHEECAVGTVKSRVSRARSTLSQRTGSKPL